MFKCTVSGVLVVALLACGRASQSSVSTIKDTADSTVLDSSRNLRYWLTLADAQRILGEDASLTDSSRKIGKISTQYLTYKGLKEDPKTKKAGAIYFLLEEFKSTAFAHTKYDDIRKANAAHSGIVIYTDVGDEAYFHSDGQNFLFIMARKGSKVMTIKVNKITSTTSRAAFDQIARRIVLEM